MFDQVKTLFRTEGGQIGAPLAVVGEALSDFRHGTTATVGERLEHVRLGAGRFLQTLVAHRLAAFVFRPGRRQQNRVVAGSFI